MVSISTESLYGSGSTLGLVAKASQNSSTLSKATTGNQQSGGGDTVSISDEARSLSEAKMKEYGVESPDQLTDEQDQEIRSEMESAGIEIPPPPKNNGQDGATQVAATTVSMATGTVGASATSASGASGNASGSGAASSSSSSDDEEKKTELENEIKALQQEVSQLRGKVKDDPEAADSLKTKQSELTSKQTELAELEQQDTQAA